MSDWIFTMTPKLIRFSAALLLVQAFASIAGAAEEYAVFRSEDRGRSWSRSDTGLPRGLRINAFGSLDRAVLVGTDSGMFISGDEGKNWEAARGVDISLGRILSFAALGRKGYAGTDEDGVLVSLGGGKSWVRNATFPSQKVRCLLAHDGKLYAGTDTDGVVASEDGKVWIPLSPGLPKDGQVFALAMVNDTLFAGLYSKGLYAWNKQESRWTKTGAVSPLALAAVVDTLVAGHNPGGLHWSGDLGTTWSIGRPSAAAELKSIIPADAGELSIDAPVWALACDDKLVVAGAANGIYHSEDRGRTWTRGRLGLPEPCPGLAFLVKQTFVLAGARNSAAHETGRRSR